MQDQGTSTVSSGEALFLTHRGLPSHCVLTWLWGKDREKTKALQCFFLKGTNPITRAPLLWLHLYLIVSQMSHLKISHWGVRESTVTFGRTKFSPSFQTLTKMWNNLSSHSWSEYKIVQSLRKIVWQCFKKLNIHHLCMYTPSICRYLLKRKAYVHKRLGSEVYINFIYNS